MMVFEEFKLNLIEEILNKNNNNKDNIIIINELYNSDIFNKNFKNYYNNYLAYNIINNDDKFNILYIANDILNDYYNLYEDDLYDEYYSFINN